jgi:hypothetical protein
MIACGVLASCAESTMGEVLDPPGGDAGADLGDSVHVRFEPRAGKLPFGVVPWPDDLYLQDAHVASGGLPESTTPTDYARVLNGSLPELDGFGISSAIYFYLDGLIDKDTLPNTAAESEGERAGVFLIDADTASPDAFKRVRAEVQWSEELKRLALRPALGHPLTPGRRYAALVTRRVKDTRGRSLEPSPKFAEVRDATSNLSDPTLQRARANYAPVLETLAKSRTLERQDVVAMAVFRVQTAAADFEDARRLVRGREPSTPSNVEAVAGAELDRVFGDPSKDAAAAPHANIASIIQGTLTSPNLLSSSAKTHGSWVRDPDGALQLKRAEEEVPFTLFLPKSNEPAPIVIYQHALKRERSDAVYVAEALAARNIAVIAIDAPFQGMRAKSREGGSVDSRNLFTGAMEPDRFGDDPELGDFYGESDDLGLLFEFHPFYIRDALRQGVVDLMSVIHFLESDRLTSLTSRVARGRALDVRRFGFIGEDIGSTMGVMLAAFEPKVQSVCLAGASAFVAQGFWLAAAEQRLFEKLAQLLGRSTVGIDYDNDSPAFWPELALFETLLGRGEPLAYANNLRRLPVNVLLMMAQDDEVIANLATEALAVALDAEYLSGTARYVGDLGTNPTPEGEKVAGNVSIDAVAVTRVLRAYEPADHRFLRSDRGEREYSSPVRPPFASLDEREHFDNPRKAALADVQEYFASYFECVRQSVATAALPCSANVVVP